MKFISLLFLIIILFSCFHENKSKKQDNILKGSNNTQLLVENSKWEYQISESCINYIEFSKKDSVTMYECQPDEKIYGIYELIGDTINVSTIKGQYDNDFPEGSAHRHQKFKFAMLLSNDTLFSAKKHKVMYIRSRI